VSRLDIGLAVWVPAFLALELPAHWNLTPWPTLSSTVWDAVRWWPPIAYFVALFLLVLIGHLDAHWSVRWLLGVSVLLAAAILAHLATR